MKEAMAVTLTPEEQDLVRRIEFDGLKLRDSEHWHANGALALDLVQSIQNGNAIPAHRWAWFTEPQFNVGGHGSSHLERFEQNGTRGNDVSRHAHFLPYLHYFIYGPNLPGSVIEAFEEKVNACGQVTSGDVIPLAKAARQLARDVGLDRKDAAEEFFKLALELDLGESTGMSIRNQVMKP
jgi:hypothetical protein